MVELPRKEAFQTGLQPEVVTSVPAPANTPKKGRGKKIVKHSLLAAALLAAVAFAADFGHHYWTVGRFIESTDDAYVKADYTTIAPKVSGYILDVLVKDNDLVKAGQVLARIDDRDYRAALAQARAEVKASEAAIRNLSAQIDLQQSIIDQARATTAATQASLTFAESDARRSQKLMENGTGSISRAEQTQSLRDQAAAALNRDRSALIAAQNKIPVLETQRDQALAQRDRSVAAAEQAELNLSYTQIIAPVDGTVGARTLRVGQLVTSGTQLMAVVPLHSVYVVANFKETQLTNIRAGQPVEVKVDSFPDVAIKGHVDSLSPASGLEFALLPPDNATGNFTKIVQRIPVKIVIDDEALAGRLRSGMSVEPEVNTKNFTQAEARDEGLSSVAG
ncbi:MAG: HlyD family secretion protein [Phyllobacterium sp.]|uniref:HlyD family secretion protein n=1 Tax=Phyllobacterium sp. TaxID=1871046 RepID=UPI0030F2FFCA